MYYSLIENSRKEGDYSNPYEFQRSWIHVVPDIQRPIVNRERLLEQKLALLEEKLDLILHSQEQTSDAPERQTRGKGKGKSTESSGFITRLRKSFQADNESSSSASNLDDPPPYEEEEDPEVGPFQGNKTIYIKKIELHLNGALLGTEI